MRTRVESHPRQRVQELYQLAIVHDRRRKLHLIFREIEAGILKDIDNLSLAKPWLLNTLKSIPSGDLGDCHIL